MSWFTKLFSGVGGDVINSIADAADKFIETDEEKNAFKLKVQALISARDSEVEQTIRKNLEAKERILVAELSQGDPYTKRARPTVVYFGLFMIFINYLVVPLASMLSGNQEPITFELPFEFWTAWGGIVATWAIGRSYEKAGAGNRVTRAVTGTSKISLLED